MGRKRKWMLYWGAIIFVAGSLTWIWANAREVAKSGIAADTQVADGIYYWKTVFRFGEWENNYVKEHHIGRLYLRLFDVDLDEQGTAAVPIATTRFESHVPTDMEVVPVVYITTPALRVISSCDSLFYERVKAMGKKHGFANFQELQLDCDWTKTNRNLYFQFCESIRKRAEADSVKVSATIRLHQLRDSVPPVDRGVLMLYNTGSLYNPETENSILNSRDVAPYLKYQTDFPLPLSYSFPTYGWGILLKNGAFSAILHQTDFTDETRYRHCEKDVYEVIKPHYLENHVLEKGDRIRLELSDMNEIRKVQEMVSDKLPPSSSMIIYHLDSLNLSTYSKEEIQAILQR